LRIIWLAGWLCVCAWQDCTGYLGAALGSEVVGWLFPLLGWGAVFGLLFLVALSSLLCVTALAGRQPQHWFRGEMNRRRRSKRARARRLKGF
jgi:hypothetical protein